MPPWSFKDQAIVVQNMHIFSSDPSPAQLAAQVALCKTLEVVRTRKVVAQRAKQLLELIKAGGAGCAYTIFYDADRVFAEPHGGHALAGEQAAGAAALEQPLIDGGAAALGAALPASVRRARPPNECEELARAGSNLLLVGGAGTGKTSVLNGLLRNDAFRTPLLPAAPTGMAASHIGGRTVHSVLGIGVDIDAGLEEIWTKVPSFARTRLRESHTVVLDEVSQLSDRLLEVFEFVARQAKEVDRPFGGMQIVLVADFLQLQPVNRAFAFQAGVWASLNLVVIEFTECYRQRDDAVFTALLGRLRVDPKTLTDADLALLVQRHVNAAGKPPVLAPRLACLRASVDKINFDRLTALEGEHHDFLAVDELAGEEPLSAVRVLDERAPGFLQFKAGAVVMFTANLTEAGIALFYNGLLGQVESFQGACAYPRVLLADGRRVDVKPFKFAEEHPANGRAISRTQIPLRLAWALTVHKAQGMSLSQACIDLDGAFAPAHVYVALSRVKRLDGLWLEGDWWRADHKQAMCYLRALLKRTPGPAPAALRFVENSYEYP